MTNGKGGRKKLVKILATVIILAIGSFFGINISDIIPSEEVSQKTESNVSEQIGGNQEVEGVLVFTMIDAGQADSFLIMQGDETALIDCGTRSTGDDVVTYLKNIGITQIDYVFGTHPHDDHMGGMYDVITNFDVGKVIMPEVESGEVTSNWYMKLMAELKSREYELEYVEVGNVYNLGDAIMTVIGPVSEASGNLNNYSTVMKVSFGEMDIIMTGDAEVEVEEAILASGANLDAEILKVGHHGSDTSTSEEFIDAVSPDYAFISCKVGNKYEHPKEDTMRKLEERNIEVYRSDENGTVVATITANDVSFSCEPGDYLSGVEVEKREQ